MFGFGKRDGTAKIRKQYEAKMAEAMELQRRGDIAGFAAKTEEAAELEKQLAAAEARSQE